MKQLARKAEQSAGDDDAHVAVAQDARQQRHHQEGGQPGERQYPAGLLGVVAGDPAQELRQHIEDVVEHHADRRR